MYDLELSPAEAMWLIGHTAHEDGIGRDIYDKVRGALLIEPPTARPTIISRHTPQMSERLAADVQATIGEPFIGAMEHAS